MIKQELLELNVVFTEISKFGNTKFKYNVLKNLEILKPLVSPLLDLEKDIKTGLKEFDDERNNLIVKLGTKGEDGNVSIDTKDSELMAEFIKELKELQSNHKESIDTYNTKIKEFQVILNEEVEETLVFKQLSIEQLPENGISIEQLNLLEKSKIITD